MRWEDIDGIATNSKGATVKVYIVSFELNLDQLSEEIVTIDFFAHSKANTHFSISGRAVRKYMKPMIQ